MSDIRNTFAKAGNYPVIFGLLVAIAISLLSIVLLAVFFYLSSVSEGYLQPVGTAIYLLGGFIGGFLAAQKAGGKGILYGLEVGICYFIFFVLVILLLTPGSLTVLSVALKGVYTLLVSAVGGILGIAFAN
jgi:putative membrane protein (TIGR04086 family)